MNLYSVKIKKFELPHIKVQIKFKKKGINRQGDVKKSRINTLNKSS